MCLLISRGFTLIFYSQIYLNSAVLSIFIFKYKDMFYFRSSLLVNNTIIVSTSYLVIYKKIRHSKFIHNVYKTRR